MFLFSNEPFPLSNSSLLVNFLKSDISFPYAFPIFENDNSKSMILSDILISDFSSIMFEYAFLFNRPFLYVNKNMNDDIYDYSELGEKPLRYQVMNKIGIELNDENIYQIDKIVESLKNNEQIKEEIHIYKNIFWEKQGYGAKNVVDYLIKKQEELEKC